MDMSSVIIPKSDQWNADDFLAGPITFTIKDVTIKGGQEQPVSISLEGTDKAYRPCKSMSRVLVHCWGKEAKNYAGRSLTLYCDPKVTWGSLAVGGIRISHLSHIVAPVTMALTATKGNKKPFTVQPLAVPVDHIADLNARADAAAAKGMDAYKAFWMRKMSKSDRAAIEAGHESRKAIATAVDAPPPPPMPTDDFDTAPEFLDDGEAA
jgi:hypothetical protein